MEFALRIKRQPRQTNWTLVNIQISVTMNMMIICAGTSAPPTSTSVIAVVLYWTADGGRTVLTTAAHHIFAAMMGEWDFLRILPALMAPV